MTLRLDTSRSMTGSVCPTKSRTELREFLSCYGSLEAAFELLDLRGSGSLGQGDFLESLAVLGFSGDAGEEFIAMDVDGDGLVSSADFVRCLSTHDESPPSSKVFG